MADGPPRRSLAGWDWLKELHDSLYAKPEFAELIVLIQFDRHMPSTPGGPIDIKAGTSVVWTHGDDDELDHHWEARRLEKRAAGLLALLPATLDVEGYMDVECWIEIHRDRIACMTSRHDGEDGDSTFNIVHRRHADAWTTDLFVTAATDLPMVDIAALTSDAATEALATTCWRIDGHSPTGISYDEEADEIAIALPPASYPDVRLAPTD